MACSAIGRHARQYHHDSPDYPACSVPACSRAHIPASLGVSLSHHPDDLRLGLTRNWKARQARQCKNALITETPPTVPQKLADDHHLPHDRNEGYQLPRDRNVGTTRPPRREKGRDCPEDAHRHARTHGRKRETYAPAGRSHLLERGPGDARRRRAPGQPCAPRG